MSVLQELNIKMANGLEPGVEQGRFAPSAAPAMTTNRLVMATFNIRYAVGSLLITGSLLRRIGLGRPGRRASLVTKNIASAARAFSDGVRMPPADVVALQEADRQTVRAGGIHVARELARALQWHYAHASMQTPRDEAPKTKQWYLDFEERIEAGETGETGVALLSRFPLANPKRIELPIFDCAWRPHLALSAVVPLAEKRVHIFNSHIDPHATTGGQLAQHRTILAHADHIASDEPIILLGDFNTLTPPSRLETRRLLESHGYTSPLPTGTPTWRAGLYRLHADWIFVRGPLRVTRWGVARPLRVSDHWPVWMEIAFDEQR